MLETYFDTPFRTSEEQILFNNSRIIKDRLVLQFLESYPQLALIIDSNRQIVAANGNALNFLKETELAKILGKRLGEALNCIHAFEMKSGCGTSIFCTECGAAQAIYSAKENKDYGIKECRISARSNSTLIALNLRVKASYIELYDEKFLLVYLEDIEAEKRKDNLERVFFHDILNTAGAIKSIIEIISEDFNDEDISTYIGMLKNSSEQLLNEITFQRMIVNAEKKQLHVNYKTYSVNSILETAYLLYSKNKKAENKNYTVEFLNDDVEIRTDKTILVRSLGNLIKNALEATQKGDSIKIFAQCNNEKVYFHVWNQGVIPNEIQLQIFQRSFSTKAEVGRGIGTYSIKLFIENFLGGEVNFVSNDQLQTQFTIFLPLNQDQSN
jgi:K+-sensing histidine kinase KdpD